jgi:O-antigen ligase
MARKFIVLVLLMLGSVDLLGSVGLAARLSGQGLQTIFYAIASVGLMLGSGRISRTGLKVAWPFIALVIWALTSMLWYTPSVSGTQNVLCLVSFIGLVLLTTGMAEVSGIQDTIESFFRYGIWLAAAAYAWCLWSEGFGSADMVGPRSFGIAALLGVAWYASKWRFGNQWAFVLTAALVVEIGASLSRVALVAGLVILTLARVSATVRGWLWGLLSLGLALASFWWMFNNIDPLREHFLSGDVKLHMGSTGINVSGRASLWRVTYDSFLDSPWIGQGAGSAQHLVESRFRNVGHPHNDYLRVLHDYGVVGLSLWLLAWLRLLRRLWAQARLSERASRADAPLQFAAFLAALGMALMMTTDNPMAYIFAMAPLGVMVGAATGSAVAFQHARTWDCHRPISVASVVPAGIKAMEAVES